MNRNKKNLILKGEEFKNVDKFNHLGNTIITNGDIREDRIKHIKEWPVLQHSKGRKLPKRDV